MSKKASIKSFQKTGIRVNKNPKEDGFMTSLLRDAKSFKIKGPADLSKNLDKYLYGGK